MSNNMDNKYADQPASEAAKRTSVRKAKLYEILKRVDSLPRSSSLSEEEILGYDERDIPEQR